MMCEAKHGLAISESSSYSRSSCLAADAGPAVEETEAADAVEGEAEGIKDTYCTDLKPQSFLGVSPTATLTNFKLRGQTHHFDL
jgi:hypothetical protein